MQIASITSYWKITTREDIEVFLSNLSGYIKQLGKNGTTLSSYLELGDPLVKTLSMRLLTQVTQQNRAKVLLEILRDKSIFGLEEEFLEKLREVK